LGTQGVVTAAFPAAAAAGAELLRSGGNAIDAACAAAWALAVCEPGESGLGGQTTMLIRLSDGRIVVVDGHSRAPEGLTRGKCGRRSQRRGYKATTVPSTPITLGEAQRKYGRRSLADAMGPAIELALNGYRITSLQRRLLRWSSKFFEPSSAAAKLFLRPDGTPYRIGEVFRQPALGATLGRLARDGVQAFYEGPMADELIADMTGNGGLLSRKDLRTLRLPVEREPLSIEHKDRIVVSLPPPGGGGQVLLALQILWGLGVDLDNPAEWYLAVASATQAAFRERERWPDHPADMTPSLARWLVSAERAERLIRKLKEDWASPGIRPPDPTDSAGESGNTTHLCAADREGNVVSLTQSIQSVFGAKVAHPTLGFVYNNYLSTCPRSPHRYRLGPGSLPQSNAAPTIVLRRVEGSDTSAHPPRPVLALGSAGSRRITSSVVQVLSAVEDRGLSLANAVSMPRAHALLSRSVWVEEGIPGGQTLSRLRSRFANVRVLPNANYKMGAVQAISWDARGQMTGAADPRRDGASVSVD
jgi:gamma-glutamyltranspeptidase/glutathione hydrolase